MGKCEKCDGRGRVVNMWQGPSIIRPLSPNTASVYRQCLDCGGTGVDVNLSQPAPTPGQEDVTEALIGDLRARQAKGIETYGTSLQTFNGRDCLQDGLEEALDLAQYLKQWQLERTKLLAFVKAWDAFQAAPDDSPDHYRTSSALDHAREAIGDL